MDWQLCRSRKGVLNFMAVVLMLLAAGCGRKPVPEKMVSSPEPNESLAVQNACVTFMAWLNTEATNLRPVSNQEVFDYAVDALEEALDQQVVDRKVFAKIFSHQDFVDSYNAMAEAKKQLVRLPDDYKKLDRALTAYGINLFFRLCSEGKMLRKDGDPVVLMGMPKKFVAAQRPDVELAMQNAAMHLLRQAQQMGFQPVREKMTFDALVKTVKEDCEKADAKKTMDPKVFVKAFSDRQYLDCQNAKYAAETLKKKASSLDQKEMTACLMAVGNFCARLQGELVDKKILVGTVKAAGTVDKR